MLASQTREEVISLAQVTYTIVLSTDGKHSVTATTDDPVAAQGALEWAKGAYEELVEFSGSVSQLNALRAEEPSTNGEAEETPMCPVHRVPMVKQEWKGQSFWSCHQKNADGSWCTYRPSGR